MIRSDVRIALLLMRTTRMGYGPSDCRPNLLGIFPKHPRCVIRLSGPPIGFAFGKLFVSQFYVKSADHRVDLDDVAILQQSDRSAHRRLRADMADAEAAGRAGEAAIGDQCYLTTHTLPGQGCSSLQHFAHAGTAARPLV